VSNPSTEPGGRYSPQLRTALVMGGTGTAGAYQAGVLRALHESGVRIDLVAGCGVGATSAAFAAIDAGAQLWEADGLWGSPETPHSYQWRRGLRVAGWCLAIALAMVVVPLAALIAGLIAFPLSFLCNILGIPGGALLVSSYTRIMAFAFDPGVLPSILPRVALAGLMGLLVVLLAVRLRRGRARHERPSGLWWSILGAPVSASVLIEHVRSRLWRVIAGAPGKREPAPADFSRRYGEVLSENLGQPRFRELLITAHDLDARRDLIFAMLSDLPRRAFFRRAAREVAQADILDLAGTAREHVVDAMLGALALPVVTEPHYATFAPEGYWRGETHRLVARPESLVRLLEEVERAAVEQVILVSAAAQVSAPHGLRPPRRDAWGRLGESFTAADAASTRDALGAFAGRFAAVFVIQPDYNALASLDFRGCQDERSDRRQTLAELRDRGYEDTCRQFIEPAVAGSEAHEPATQP
jgi:hypothetical protein